MKRLTSVRGRLILAVAGLALIPSIAGTYAYWTDSAEVLGGAFTSGKLDLRFDDGVGAVGLGTGYAKASVNWSGVTPGERKAFGLKVNNMGDPPFTYSTTVTRGTDPAWTYIGSPVTFQVYSGTPVVDATYPQQDTCTGEALGSLLTVDGTNKQALTTAQTVTAGGSQQLCLIVGLDAAATDNNQGKTGSITLTFTAEQQVTP